MEEAFEKYKQIRDFHDIIGSTFVIEFAYLCLSKKLSL